MKKVYNKQSTGFLFACYYRVPSCERYFSVPPRVRGFRMPVGSVAWSINQVGKRSSEEIPLLAVLCEVKDDSLGRTRTVLETRG